MRILTRFLLALSLAGLCVQPAYAQLGAVRAVANSAFLQAGQAKAAATTVARLQRTIRAFNRAQISNPRTLAATSAYALTDNAASLPSWGTSNATQTTSSRGVLHTTGGALQASGGPKAAIQDSSNTAVPNWNRSDFMFSGPKVALRLAGTTAPYRFMVDGQYVSTGNSYNNLLTTQSSGSDYVILTLPDNKPHRITVEGMQGGYLIGAYFEASSRAWAVDLADAVHAVFLGDSYVQGTTLPAASGNTTGAHYADGVSGQLGDYLGLYLTPSGVGGTDWNQSNGSVYTFNQRIANGDLGLGYYKPDIIFLMASVNGAYSSNNFTTVQANALAGFQAARAQYPGVPIVVFGCVPAPAKSSTYITAEETAVAAAVAQQQAAGDSLIAFVPVNSDAAGAWVTGAGAQIIFTGALSAATSGNLATAWSNSTGTYTILFSDGTTKSVTLTQNSTAVTWTGAVTATAIASAYTTLGSSSWAIAQDYTHPSLPDGASMLAQRYAAGARAAIRSMYQSLLGAPVAIQ